MPEPILFIDPISEPSRAVHWFTLEAGVPVTLRYVWLTRNQHQSPEFAAVNPRRQVPALLDGDFALSEATAIFRYLAASAGVDPVWLGKTPHERARVDQLFSWYHTNLRLRSTLEYFLPVLLVPSFGAPRPAPERVAKLRERARESLAGLEGFLGGAPYLGGERPRASDLLLAAEFYALDCDPDRAALLEGFPAVCAWEQRMRGLPGYGPTHTGWNAAAPLVLARLREDAPAGAGAAWIADACERALAVSPP
jgi:glutathione S-transferase